MVGAERGGKNIGRAAHVHGRQDVFKNGHGLEQTNVLERARDAALCDLVGRVGDGRQGQITLRLCSRIALFHLAARMVADDGFAHEVHTAVGRLVNTGDAVEGCGLAGAVRADERHDLPLGDMQRQVVDCHDAAELHRDIFHAEDVFTHLLCPPQLRSSLPFSLAYGTDPAARARP